MTAFAATICLAAVAWGMIKADHARPSSDGTCVWLDGDRLRVVRARSVRETWYQFDVELVERNILPQCKRRGLSN